VTKMSESYGLLQAANKGGHGASKNMIGTRGENKVIVLMLLHLPAKLFVWTIIGHLTNWTQWFINKALPLLGCLCTCWHCDTSFRG
jgi:hypothetical protein